MSQQVQPVASDASKPAPLQVVVSQPADEKRRLKQLRKEEHRKAKEEHYERKKRRREAREAAAACLPDQPATDANASIPATTSQQQQQQPSLASFIHMPPSKRRCTPAERAPQLVPKGSSGARAVLAGESLPLAADLIYRESFNLLDFTSEMKLKKDHHIRPITLLPTGCAYLDMNGPFSRPASDFLVAVAEPVSRPENIHEFQLTVFSLYAAIGLGITIDEIITNLNKFSKNEIPANLMRLLKLHGESFGKVKLVLRDNRYYLEAESKADLDFMLTDPAVAKARIRNSTAVREVREGVCWGRVVKLCVCVFMTIVCM